jgi:glycosyltransferase involved in cell wall biosynthesis
MPRSVFHEFVPVSIIDRDEERELREQYVLLVGAPWYLKGADILIEAFLRLAGDFPDIKLKLLGYYPDRTELQALTRGSGQIEILQARPHPEALKIIKGATVVVLPSRCEGLGRVLIEAMAAAVPVIGSDVGGIPMLIRDGENGFLVPVGDHQMLSIRLRQLLDDEQLRRKMGESGYVRAHRELNEETYAREFAGMIKAAVSRKKT